MTITSSRRPGRLAVLTGAVTLALTLAACSGTDGASGGGGTLTVGAATNVQTLDPQMAAVAQEYYLNPVFDTLVQEQSDGTHEAGLAEEWEIVDPTTFELQVRPDVTFSDGAPMDADAVVANFERGMAMEASPSASFYSNIDSVEVVDDSTVRLNLTEPTTDMLSQLSRLPGMMMSPASFDADPDTQPVGAGGWTHDAAASNPGEVQVYQANPEYWDPDRVGVDTIEMRVLEDASAATNAVLDGQVDIIEMRSEADRSTLENASLQLIERANPNVYYLQIMDTDGTLVDAMGDEQVRRALNLAIDREAIQEGLQFGQGDPSPGFWLSDSPYHEESLEDLAHDPDEARRLLADAGYEDGFSVTFPAFGAITEMAEAIQQMWADVGIDVTIEQVEPGTLADVMRNGETAMAVTLARGFTAESHYDERHAPGSPYDPLGTDRGEVAELADVALNAETEESQAEGWRDVYTYLIEQGYLMVVAHQVPVVVTSERASGVELSSSDNLPKPYDITLE
ncbi:ABC transporter substrate-binding protein [Aeromicrobium sp. CTD01-1L150]|uniref:ABC transporter substrate-binding protein n=1 Tax=Aeromicrobium sp. CTD01-1L150 TaxID=3341830 RepID=UPI0035C12CB7